MSGSLADDPHGFDKSPQQPDVNNEEDEEIYRGEEARADEPEALNLQMV